MRRYRPGLALVVCAIVLGSTLPVWSIPVKIGINGRLLDKSGNPVLYYTTVDGVQVETTASLAARVWLYDSGTTPTPFDTIDTSAFAHDGFFHIGLVLPTTAIVKDNLWYALAIDADRNGLGSEDSFPDRFEIGSVPFAISAKPVKSFTTFSGFRSGWGSVNKHYGTLMSVVPFETPSGGVEFNQMNTFLGLGQVGSAFSFGIYDQQGKLVASSGLITIKQADINAAFLQTRHPKTTLQPSSIYYIGYARANTKCMLPQGYMPVAPVMGYVTIPNATGEIPATFNPDTIAPDYAAHALPVTFTLADEHTLPKDGWISDKSEGSQYRWIFTKKSE